MPIQANNMLHLTHDIHIANRRFLYLNKIKIRKSIHALADEAEIFMPGMQNNTGLQIDKEIHLGDAIRIALGYNGNNQLEFSGFVRSISTRNYLRIVCEDALHTLRKPLGAFKQVEETLEALVQRIIEGSNLSLEIHPSLTSLKLKGFAIAEGTTGFDALSRLKNYLSINIYARGSSLYCTPQHSSDSATGRVLNYAFDSNIEHSALRYRRASERPLHLQARSILANGEHIEVSVGEKTGESIRQTFYQIEDKATLRFMAQERLKQLSYDGFEGYFTGWLHPFCSYGDLVRIQDDQYPERTGQYFVERQEISVSAQGGQRKIYLALRTS